MLPKYHLLLFVFLLILVVSFPNEARSIVAENWKPIRNLKDPKVVMVAKFAVMEHNKQANKTMNFVIIVKGEQQLVAGVSMKYRLVISAKDGAAAHPKNYSAVVQSWPWLKTYILILSYFEEFPAIPMFVGGWETIRNLDIFIGGWKTIRNLKDPYVVMIAMLAVMEHNKHANKSLNFVAVVKGEDRVVAGLFYKLVISVKNNGTAHFQKYRARVWDRPWRPGISEFVLQSFKEIKG